ncbi:MAG: GIY-YIG nuclease family protein [Bacteroidota bacterium]
MHFTVYVLYSDTAKKHYTGFTGNFIERLKSHNELGDEWTARYRPWRLIFQKDFEAKLDAMKYEQWLKKGQGRAFIITLPH